MLITFSGVRNTGLMICPTTAMSTIAGTRTRSRSLARATRPPMRLEETPRASSGIDGHSFHRGDEVVVAPASGQLGDDAALHQYHNSIAQPQVVDFVGGDHH